MIIATAPQPAGDRTVPVAIATLTVTQTIGWGTTFHVPAVLSERVGADTGLSPAVVFGGLTIMLVVAAVLAPWAGRLLERRGSRILMMAGSLLTALGLAILAFSRGPLGFGLAWAVLGLAMPFALNQAASTALVQIAPDRARRAIAVVLMLSGFSGTLAWPALIWLDGAFGWRGAVLIGAALNVLVCLPLHAVGLPRGRVVPLAPLRPSAAPDPAPPDARPVPGAFWLTAVTFSLSGMLTWGLPLHMIGILRDYGHAEATAVWIGALFGPGQVLARGFELFGGRRFDILTVGVVSALLMPLALALLLAAGSSISGAVGFAIAYGVSAGLATIVRAVAPLRLFGAAAYATVLGRLSVPQNAAFATAPLGFAAIRDAWGAPALAALALAIAAICLVTTVILAARARRAATSPG